MALLAIYSWGFPLSAVFQLLIFYLAIYFTVYFPFFYIFPKFTLRSLKPIRESYKENNALTTEEAKRAIEFLINSPIKISMAIFVIVYSAFCLGALLLHLGVLPVFNPIKSVIVSEALLLGIAVAMTESFLNQLFMEARFNQEVSRIINIQPEVLQEDLKIKNISLSTKVFFLISFTITASLISVIVFFITNFQVYVPEIVPQLVIFTLFLCGLIIIYILLIAPVVAGEITQPLTHLITWNKNIMEGKSNSKVDMLTNDEIGTVINYSNRMMDTLNETKQQLVQSLQQLRHDKSIIAGQNKKMSIILSEIIDGVVALDDDYRIVLSNKAAQLLLQQSENEIENKHIDDVLRIYDEKNKRILSPDYCHSSKASQNQVFEKNFAKLVLDNNKPIYINMTVHTINAGPLSDVKYLITVHDVTQEKEFEENKLDFVSVTAHELQSPLTSIIGYTSIFQSTYRDKLNEDQAHLMNRINVSANLLGELVENLLNVTRLEKDTRSLHMEKVDWVELIAKAIDEAQYHAEEKEITVTFERPSQDVPLIEGDPLKLREGLTNLLSNAIKYTDNNGKVSIALEINDEQITTHVTDTGIGIAKEAQQNLFNKFYRVESDKHVQQEKGTGLGLFIVKSLLELHHGEIWLESEEGKGSTFSFSLPIRREN